LDDVLKLPQTLDVAAVRAVREDLLTRRGTATTMDASDIERIGALGVELLIAAQRQWQKDDSVLQLVGLSEAVTDAFTDLGLDAAVLGTRNTDLERGTQ
jgi:chemotaxis protein CheX